MSVRRIAIWDRGCSAAVDKHLSGRKGGNLPSNDEYEAQAPKVLNLCLKINSCGALLGVSA